MSGQPEALRLADVCEATTADPSLCNAYSVTLLDAAAELRRLHAVNAQMLEALLAARNVIVIDREDVAHCHLGPDGMDEDGAVAVADYDELLAQIDAAIASATGEQAS